jgi:hypothetical protein
MMEIGKLLKLQNEEKKKAEVFTVTELALLLTLIKGASFRGEDIESVYNLVLKLQDMYLAQNK